MDYLIEGVKRALGLIFSLDREVLGIVMVSLRVSSVSTLLATFVGVFIGFCIATKEFWGKRGVVNLLNTLMSLPTVVVGLTVYSFLSRSGPLGTLGLLYTPTAMILGQFILATPIIAALTLAACQGVDRRVMKTAMTLGATGVQTALTVFSEARYAILAAIIAGFGRVFAEVGVSMMVGGNIRGYTRNITTAIAFETAKGEFALGIALGLILLTIAFFITYCFTIFKGKAINTG